MAGTPQHVQSLEMEHRDSPWSVDLHTALERWYYRGLRVGLEGAFDNVEPMSWGAHTVSVLRQPHLAAFLALHASYEVARMQLIRLVELVLVIRRDRAGGSLRWSELQGLLTHTAMGRFVYPALVLVERLAPGTIDPDFRLALEGLPTRRMRRVVEAADAADLGPLSHRSLDDKLLWAHGPGQHLLALSELLWPSDDGMPVGVGRLYWRRLQAWAGGRAGWRAGS